MTKPLIKICGLSTPESIEAAIKAGATHIGLVHFPKSPRHVTVDRAAELRTLIPAEVKAVLLTVNMDPKPSAEILQAVQPDVLQLHGNETPEWCALIKGNSQIEVWKAVGIKNSASLARAERYATSAHRMLYDAPSSALPGGNGLALDWRLLMNYKHKIAWGLAGGLNAGNVGDAVRYTGAELVDTSSGVESAPGVKDIDKIKAFCKAAREAMMAKQ